MIKALNRFQIIKLINMGWELGNDSGQGAHYWMQRRLGSGGQSIIANGNAINWLVERRMIVVAPKKKDDPWYLKRWRINMVSRDGIATPMYAVLGYSKQVDSAPLDSIVEKGG